MPGPGIFMPYLYILKSLKDRNLYVGTTTDIDNRIEKHNKGLVKSTKSRRPLELIYKEYFSNLSDARKKEWEFKYTPWGGKLKKKLVSRPAESSNGRTEEFGSSDLGSNPSSAGLDTIGHKNT